MSAPPFKREEWIAELLTAEEATTESATELLRSILLELRATRIYARDTAAAADRTAHWTVDEAIRRRRRDGE